MTAQRVVILQPGAPPWVGARQPYSRPIMTSEALMTA